MKKKALYIVLIISLIINLTYLLYRINQKNRKDEFFSIFNVTNISYPDGFAKLNKEIINKNLQKPNYVIQIWDTLYLEFDKKIPYLLNADSICKNTDKVQCFLISSMYDESIQKCIKERNIHFNNFILINNMEDYISGICIAKGRKTKPTCATIIVKYQGDILFYEDKPIKHLDKDSKFLKILDSLNNN